MNTDLGLDKDGICFESGLKRIFPSLIKSFMGFRRLVFDENLDKFCYSRRTMIETVKVHHAWKPQSIYHLI